MPANDSAGTLDNATLAFLQDRRVMAALPAVYSLVAAISVPGNLLSLWVLARHVRPWSPASIFMVQLAASDLGLAALLPAQALYHLRGHRWTLGRGLCAAVTLGFYANMYTSVLTVTLISADRYLAVVRPLTAARWRRRRYALGACLASWVLVLAALSPLAAGDLTFEVRPLGITTCFDVLQWTLLPGPAAWACFLLTLSVLLFVAPMLVTVGCYAAVIRALVRPDGRGQRSRAVALAGLVLASFVGCYAPNNVLLVLHVVARLFYGRSYYSAYKLTLCLSCLSNALDPFIYYFASREFQRRFRDYLAGLCGAVASSGREVGGTLLGSPRTLSVRSGAGEPQESEC